MYILNYIYPYRYNPEHDPDSRLLRHRASALQDLAHSIFDHELSEDFEQVSKLLISTRNVESLSFILKAMRRY